MDLGLGYEKIHACPNDCTLYWSEMAGKDSCPKSSCSRWKSETDKGKVPAKVMRYFPLIPKLRRMYMSSKISKDMRWHDECRHDDGILKHSADGQAWKEFNVRYPEFSNDARSVRLGLASDGFNPYRLMNMTYSIWPIILIPYNLSPWLCMKPSSFILSMIIPGKEGPGNNIDIYMCPLIHELKLLWKGVNAFDSYASVNFKLQAALMWTINDFPAYAMLSAWSTKGYNAFPECNFSTPSTRVGNKICYIGHRKWLPRDHPFRFQSSLFDGTEEYGSAPSPMAGSDVLREQQTLEHEYGKIQKSCKRRKRQSISDIDVNDPKILWTKRSIFFDLPYWEHNILRHNLDVMHIEKNVCDNLLGTLMNMDGKSKDDEFARMFFENRNVKPHFWLQRHSDNEFIMPLAPYCMTGVGKESFLHVLASIKFPDGYSSNLSRCVNLKNKKLMNLKSHDNHILMQDILPIALKSSQAFTVIDLVDDLSSFFKSLCAKEIDPNYLDALESKIIDVLCQMEIEFLPPFFTIMVHLLIHLVKEVKLRGPVHYRLMYLVHLKTFLRNRAQPEGYIAEGYILEETITFCSRYLEGVETLFNRPRRNDDDK
ncbi:uncharacterized protein LOC130799249 [Amaranthus tricolor]|uniref:uncharacterized protein LOC130799249 n=1 Tax=Amaranthus tricolor TaxID=29722 RepID=UPI002585EBDE|nr:uncharacterized protein LOC130799249 [Amaranthus tricolor]